MQIDPPRKSLTYRLCTAAISLFGGLVPQTFRQRWEEEWKAEVELVTLAARLEHGYPDTNTGRGVRVRPLSDSIIGETRPALTLLLAAAAFVLLVACTNIDNLLMAVGTERRKEMAIRTALGAG